MKKVKQKTYLVSELVCYLVLKCLFVFVFGDVTQAKAKNEDKLLHIEVYLEGFYDDGKEKMLSAHTFIDQQQLPVFDEGIADKITVSLHDDVNYENYNWGDKIVFQADVVLTNDGHAWVSLPEKVDNKPVVGQYWVSVTHRNHLETIYHTPITIDENGIYHCNFIQGSHSENSAFGNNQSYLGEKVRHGHTIHAWALYAGDINSDGNIDFLDRNLLRSSLEAGHRGYLQQDLNGDGLVSIRDRTIFMKNFLLGLNAIKPSGSNAAELKNFD